MIFCSGLSEDAQMLEQDLAAHQDEHHAAK